MILGRVLYAAAFVLMLPALLVAWAMLTAAAVQLPAPHWPLGGAVMAAVGLALMAGAMWSLWKRGGGLPMNAFPPRRFVFSGVYRLLPHPIYVGFATVCLGVALATGSASGLWLVSPAAMLGAVALVAGYEHDALLARFGPPPGQTLLRLPRDDSNAPDAWDRASVLILVLAPWCMLYMAIGHLPVRGGIDSTLAFERSWPVWTWTTPVYTLAYPFAILTPWVAASRRFLRRFAIVGLLGTALGMLAYLLAPVHAMPRPFDESAPFGWLLQLERIDGMGGRNALPAFHVFWVVVAAEAWASRGRTWGVVGWALAVAIAASCVTTGMHALLDLAGGVVLYAASRWAGAAWRVVVRWTEVIANSWREWRVGPVRVINHGLYAGAAAAAGVLIASSLAGPSVAGPIGLVGLVTLAGGAIWGQALVGSATILRPFGYFGAILGAALGMAVASRLGADFWPLAAALAAAAPWVVLIGRFRCLVQGCCHGRPVQIVPGVRYRHPRSRVCRIAHLDGVPIHPTPVYSMASNAVLGLFLLRLWFVGAPCSMIAGIYLLFAGLSRFVEEHFRGEPQTQIVGGLRIYQWFAAASALAGIAVSGFPSPAAFPVMSVGWHAIVIACGVGVMFAIAMGVDLPESSRRFSRLA